MRLIMLPLVERFGKNRVVIVSILLAGLPFLALPLVSGVVALTIASLGFGLSLGVGQPLSISTTIALSPRAKLGEVLGVRLGCNQFTQAIVPLAFGGAVLVTGVVGVFAVVGTVL